MTSPSRILTVGIGSAYQYQTLASAVAASQSGDTIAVQAGTYANDFPGLVSNITIEGVGGMAHFVDTQRPPNQKAEFVTSGTVTLKNIEVSGVTVADLNGAGVRYQGGDLTLQSVYFHDNQEGLLTINDPTGRITILDSEFADNGSNGYAHNIYIDDVGTTVVDNTYIHDVLGHGSEFRSRGANTTITNSRIVDGGHADNYTVDLPAGGNVVLQNDVFEKAAGATNRIMIHYGIDYVVPWHPSSSLTANGNTFINQDGALASGIFNGAYLANANVTVQGTGNNVFGLAANRVEMGGPSNLTNTTLLGSAPAVGTTHPWQVDPPSPTPAPVPAPPTTSLPGVPPASSLGPNLSATFDPATHAVRVTGSVVNTSPVLIYGAADGTPVGPGTGTGLTTIQYTGSASFSARLSADPTSIYTVESLEGGVVGRATTRIGSDATTFNLHQADVAQDLLSGLRIGQDHLHVTDAAGVVLSSAAASGLIAGATSDSQGNAVLHLSATHDVTLSGVAVASLSAGLFA